MQVSHIMPDHAQQAHVAPRPRTPPCLPPPQADRIPGIYANFTDAQALSYLDGSLPGDFGFDPLGLSDPEGAGGFIDPKWLAYR